MEPFPFQRLPLELKIKIIREALPRLIVPDCSDTFQPYSWAERVWVGNLTKSCKEIRSIVNNIRKIVAFGHGKIFFRLDPIRDTLLVKEMCLPHLESTKDWDPATSGLDHHALPIRSLMTQSFSIMALKGPEDYPGLTHPYPPQTAYQQWSKVPFSTPLPLFSYLPLVEELVLSIQDATSEWNIDGFQMFGPDIIASRRREEGWPFARVDSHDTAAAEYFASRGISADTGENWIIDMEVLRGSDLPSALIDRITGYGIDVFPRIGFYGFSRGTMSHGGKWAGFRYFTETNEVHFSPLAWSEVQYFVHRWYTSEGMVINAPGEPHPQLIARVWIIKPGKEAEPAQPHHCWLKVKKWEEGDPDWVAQVETMWKMVRGHLLAREYDSSYKLCMAGS